MIGGYHSSGVWKVAILLLDQKFFLCLLLNHLQVYAPEKPR